MSRQTLKYKQALSVARKLANGTVKSVPTDHNALYRWLGERNWFWNPDFQVFNFQKRSVQSVFVDDSGQDTGEWRIRIRAAPETAAALTIALEEWLPKQGYAVSDVSNHERDNSGASVRVYLQGKLKSKKGKKS